MRSAVADIHSRAGQVKQPATRAELLRVYPDDLGIDVRFLSASRSFERSVDPIRAIWTTFEFNEIDSKEFLQSIKFFVYYHHRTGYLTCS